MAGRSEPTVEQATSAVAEVMRLTAAVTNRRRPVDAPTGEELLACLDQLRWLQRELSAAEPRLIAAARNLGVSWQALAPVLGVASRQAAERRYLRLVPAADEADPGTRDGRVQAVRDRRAGDRAVGQWANDHSADLRGLAGQITALTGLDVAATTEIRRLHRALGDADATALPALLANTHSHLKEHPHLAEQVARLGQKVEDVRRMTQRRRDRGR
jgi:hypothetical protein